MSFLKIFFLFLISISNIRAYLLPTEFIDNINSSPMSRAKFFVWCYAIIGICCFLIAAFVFQLMFSLNGCYYIYKCCYFCWRRRNIPDDDDLQEVIAQGEKYDVVYKYKEGCKCTLQSDLNKKVDQLRVKLARHNAQQEIVAANLDKFEPQQLSGR
ncbi:hypothetical protein XELAEV_18038725mg [Xenopus laevis]|uniref:Uncharacterized protein n=1 Tax=Xenopus laevis TaxID=8355 RepID=A0A974H754_XENLA|nr:hypothetical protein XELAEV_18038725mg [Xenopus laevis]